MFYMPSMGNLLIKIIESAFFFPISVHTFLLRWPILNDPFKRIKSFSDSFLYERYFKALPYAYSILIIVANDSANRMFLLFLLFYCIFHSVFEAGEIARGGIFNFNHDLFLKIHTSLNDLPFSFSNF